MFMEDFFFFFFLNKNADKFGLLFAVADRKNFVPNSLVFYITFIE